MWQKVGMGLTFQQVASRLQIAVGTAHRIFVRFRDTGSLSPQERHGKRRPSTQKLDDLHELYILGITADNPGLYLHEITSRIKEATNMLLMVRQCRCVQITSQKWIYTQKDCSDS